MKPPRLYPIIIAMSCFLILAVNCSNLAPSKPENDLTEMKLNGPVKKMIKFEKFDDEWAKIEEYYFNKYGNKTEFNAYLNENILISSTTYSYNEFNKLEKSIITGEDKQYKVEYIYKYDDKQQLIESRNNELTANLTTVLEYVYDEKGNLIEEITTFPGVNNKSSSLFEYDQFGNKIKALISGGEFDGEPFPYLIFEYDNKNRLTVKRENIAIDGTGIEYIYTYDDNDNIIQEDVISNGLLAARTDYTYDEHNNIVLLEAYNYWENPDSLQPMVRQETQFVYDNYNNWVSKTDYVKRLIEYDYEQRREFEYW